MLLLIGPALFYTPGFSFSICIYIQYSQKYHMRCKCFVVDGGWSSWTKGSCSKTCGGGIRIDNRTCNNPTPSCGGLRCADSSTREESCNVSCCPGIFINYKLNLCMYQKVLCYMKPSKFKVLNSALFHIGVLIVLQARPNYVIHYSGLIYTAPDFQMVKHQFVYFKMSSGYHTIS